MTDDHDVAIAQLRHAYVQLLAGKVKNQKSFANGLLAPSIRKLEKALRLSDLPDAEIARRLDNRLGLNTCHGIFQEMIETLRNHTPVDGYKALRRILRMLEEPPELGRPDERPSPSP